MSHHVVELVYTLALHLDSDWCTRRLHAVVNAAGPQQLAIVAIRVLCFVLVPENSSVCKNKLMEKCD